MLIGTLIPAILAVALTAAYVRYSTSPITSGAMQGARAGALAVLLWAVVRLIRPQLAEHRTRGTSLAVAVLVAALALPVPQLILLVASAGLGAVLLRRTA